MNSLLEEITRGPVVLDGGLATELEHQGIDTSGHLWSARLLGDDPSSIVRAHRAFFDAGASIATSASYQATFEGFASSGLGRHQARLLMERSVHLAQEAASEVSGRSTYVAASIGPYGAMLADGSEYRGDYGLSVNQLREFHRSRLEVLVGSGADVLALETIPCAAEAEALLLEISGLGLPAWLSVTVAGGTTRNGEPLADVFAMSADVPEVIAVGINCSSPSDATAGVPIAAAATGKPVVVYPNSGEVWNAGERAWSGEGALSPTLVSRWIADGAAIVGGCCRVTPDQILVMAETVRDLPEARQ